MFGISARSSSLPGRHCNPQLPPIWQPVRLAVPNFLVLFFFHRQNLRSYYQRIDANNEMAFIMDDGVVAAAAAVIVIASTLALMHVLECASVASALRAWRRVLVVIAHPDDEAMFFVPTLQALRATAEEVIVLCLSTGNAAGIGHVRVRELHASATLLGAHHVEVVDDAEMQDGMNTKWPVDRVAEHVRACAVRHGVETILTFDGRGVTGHVNHVAASLGVQAAAETMPELRIAMLQSVSLLRRFVGWLDIAVSTLEAGGRDSRARHVVVALDGARHAIAAMRCHASQWVWFRQLFVVFSCYAYVNVVVETQAPAIQE